MNAGIGNPRRDLAIALGGCALGAGLLGSGLWAMDDPDSPGWASAATAIGLLLCIVFPLFAVNFLWAVRLTDRMKRGDGVIARWTVPAHTLEEFRADDADPRKKRRKNDYKLPRKIPPEGLEVIFSPDAVMIGNTFFGLARSGIARFTDVAIVRGNPLSIAFRMALTTARATSYGSAHLATSRSELRVPVARTASAEASKVLAHYTAVDQGRIQVKPKFWTLRLKIGLWAAALGATSFALGMTLNALKIELGLLPFLMAVIGGVIAPFGLVLAGIAWRIREGEKRGR